MRETILPAIFFGFLLDCLVQKSWTIHPMQWMVQKVVKQFQSILPNTQTGRQTGGTLMVIWVMVLSLFGTAMVLWVCSLAGTGLRLCVESVFCWAIFAVRSIRDRSMAVWKALEADDLSGAQTAVSTLVKRDTAHLPAQGIIRATVEGVAVKMVEEAVMPLIFLMIGGVPLGCLCVSVTLLNHMLERDDAFGKVPAHVGDTLRYFPARFCALLTIGAAELMGQNGKRAYAVWKRDQHKSGALNRTQTEAAYAGALGILLGGVCFYNGIPHIRPAVGDDTRSALPGDIRTANQLLYIGLLLAFSGLGLVRIIILLCVA